MITRYWLVYCSRTFIHRWNRTFLFLSSCCYALCCLELGCIAGSGFARTVSVLPAKPTLCMVCIVVLTNAWPLFSMIECQAIYIPALVLACNNRVFIRSQSSIMLYCGLSTVANYAKPSVRACWGTWQPVVHKCQIKYILYGNYLQPHWESAQKSLLR
jgi:hypothetical protein